MDDNVALAGADASTDGTHVDATRSGRGVAPGALYDALTRFRAASSGGTTHRVRVQGATAAAAAPPAAVPRWPGSPPGRRDVGGGTFVLRRCRAVHRHAFEQSHTRWARRVNHPILGCEPYALLATIAAPVGYLFLILAAYVSVVFLAVAWLITGGVWWLADEAEFRLSRRSARGNGAVLVARVLASLVAMASVAIAYLLVRRYQVCAPAPSYHPPSYCSGGGLLG